MYFTEWTAILEITPHLERKKRYNLEARDIYLDYLALSGCARDDSFIFYLSVDHRCSTAKWITFAQINLRYLILQTSKF